MSNVAHAFDPASFPAFLRGVARLVPFAREAAAMYFCLIDPETPTWVRGAIVGALAYFVCPLDLIPDFLPGGWVDDASVIAGALAAIRAHITPEHWAAADRLLGYC